MDISRFQADLVEAAQRDYQDLDTRLRGVREDGEGIMAILQADGYDRRPAKEVLIAFTKVLT